MNHTLYLECGSGISGDMTVAALLDLGADRQKLEQALKSLSVSGYEIQISRVKKSGLDVCDFHVKLDKAHENHDHDMEYLHGEGHEHHHHDHDHEHDHNHEHPYDQADNTEEEHTHPYDQADEHDAEEHEHTHEHHHDHPHEHPHEHHHHHHHEHRGLKEILDIISGSAMTDNAKAIASRIFMILAEAEAKAHGTTLENVHFHEVGAVDSIVDIAAAAVCLDDLNITNVVIPYLNEGQGFIRCQHGVIPVPVPATLNIVNAHGLNLHLTNIQGELVTPTGAAIAAAIQTSDKLPERFRILKTGIGAGKRQYERPSLLRAMLIEDTGVRADGVWKLETDVDDCTGEVLGYVMKRLQAAGAREVHFTPIFMKKHRPAYEITVLCDEEHRQTMEEILFAETTTIGVRRVWMERTVLQRELRTVETPWGAAQVKVCTLSGGKRAYPEHDSVAALAKASGRPYQEIYQTILETANSET